MIAMDAMMCFWLLVAFESCNDLNMLSKAYFGSIS